MEESFVQFVWQFSLFSLKDLKLSDGRTLVIVKAGRLNKGAGPDFSDALIEVDGITWAGNCEIHTNSSDWDHHGHTGDPKYENVILHVVWNHDREVIASTGLPLPTLELKSITDHKLLASYQSLVQAKEQINCNAQLQRVPAPKILQAVNTSLVERLEQKSDLFLDIFQASGQDWQETTYIFLAKAFGGSVNGEVFQRMAQRVPLKLIRRHSESQMQVESLLFGIGGWLDETIDQDPYLQLITRESQFLIMKYGLSGQKLKKVEWQTGRIRPQNHPVIRIAQFAAMLRTFEDPFGYFMSMQDSKQLIAELGRLDPGEFWETRYTLHSSHEKPKKKRLSKSFVQLLLINAVAVVYAAYSRENQEYLYMEKAIKLLEHLPMEKNNTMEHFHPDYFPRESAADSQGLLQLYKHYCQKNRCLQCSIGSHLVRAI